MNNLFSFCNFSSDAEKHSVEYCDIIGKIHKGICTQVSFRQEFGDGEVFEASLPLDVVEADINRYFKENFREMYQEMLLNNKFYCTPQMLDHYFNGNFDVVFTNNLNDINEKVVSQITKQPVRLEIYLGDDYEICA